MIDIRSPNLSNLS